MDRQARWLEYTMGTLIGTQGVQGVHGAKQHLLQTRNKRPSPNFYGNNVCTSPFPIQGVAELPPTKAESDATQYRKEIIETPQKASRDAVSRAKRAFAHADNHGGSNGAGADAKRYYEEVETPRKASLAFAHAENHGGSNGAGADATQYRVDSAESRIAKSLPLQQQRKIMMDNRGGRHVPASYVQTEYNFKLRVAGLLAVGSDINFLPYCSWERLFKKFKNTGNAREAAEAAVANAKEAQAAPALYPHHLEKLLNAGITPEKASSFLKGRKFAGIQFAPGCAGSCAVQTCKLCKSVADKADKAKKKTKIVGGEAKV